MKMFLLACIAVVVLGVAANLILETQFAASSGETYAIDGSTRLSPQYFGDERGFLAPRQQED
jgi:hypothetical protein